MYITRGPDPSNDLGSGGAQLPPVPDRAQGAIGIDQQLARLFARATALLEQGHWITHRFPVDPGRSRYRIPERDGVIFLPLRDPAFRADESKAIERLIEAHDIRELHLYDTTVTPSVLDLCLAVRERLQRLVIRDHHGDEWRAQTRAHALGKIYGRAVSITLKSRAAAATAFELVDREPPLLARHPERRKLVLCSPLDFDSLQCVGAALGFRYQGQEVDVQAIEAKAKAAKRAGVSELGGTILDALRVMPMVVTQQGQPQGHKIFGTLFLMASLQAMALASKASNEPTATGAETWRDSAAGETLLFLADIQRTVTRELLFSLINQNVHAKGGKRAPVTFSFIDLSGKHSDVISRFDAALDRNATSIDFTRLNAKIEVTPSQALVELVRDPERLRMSSVENAGAALIAAGRLPADSLIFVAFPDREAGTIVRFVAFGRCREAAFQKNSPFLHCRGLSGTTGMVKDLEAFRAWW